MRSWRVDFSCWNTLTSFWFQNTFSNAFAMHLAASAIKRVMSLYATYANVSNIIMVAAKVSIWSRTTIIFIDVEYHWLENWWLMNQWYPWYCQKSSAAKTLFWHEELFLYQKWFRFFLYWHSHVSSNSVKPLKSIVSPYRSPPSRAFVHTWRSKMIFGGLANESYIGQMYARAHRMRSEWPRSAKRKAAPQHRHGKKQKCWHNIVCVLINI